MICRKVVGADGVARVVLQPAENVPAATQTNRPITDDDNPLGVWTLPHLIPFSIACVVSNITCCLSTIHPDSYVHDIVGFFIFHILIRETTLLVLNNHVSNARYEKRHRLIDPRISTKRLVDPNLATDLWRRILYGIGMNIAQLETTTFPSLIYKFRSFLFVFELQQEDSPSHVECGKKTPKPFIQCEICGKKFYVTDTTYRRTPKERLTLHIVTEHDKERLYECNVEGCFKAYNNIKQLNQHKLVIILRCCILSLTMKWNASTEWMDNYYLTEKLGFPRWPRSYNNHSSITLIVDISVSRPDMA